MCALWCLDHIISSDVIISTTPCNRRDSGDQVTDPLVLLVTQCRDAAAYAQHWSCRIPKHTHRCHHRWCADTQCQGQAATRTHAHNSKRDTLFIATCTLLPCPSGPLGHAMPQCAAANRHSWNHTSPHTLRPSPTKRSTPHPASAKQWRMLLCTKAIASLCNATCRLMCRWSAVRPCRGS